MFKLLVPCGYPAPCRLRGPVGALPDLHVLGIANRCRRNALPPFLPHLTLELVSNWAYQSSVHIWNFYHLGELFVATDEIRRFLEEHSGAEFEVAPIRVTLAQVERPGYWAMKVMTRLDCIDPDRSFAEAPLWPSKGMGTFSELELTVELEADVAPGFANEEDAKTYSSYPHDRVGAVSLKDGAIPDRIKLLEPRGWPGELLIEQEFAYELERRCRGGTVGYYFFALALDAVDRNYRNTMTVMR